MSAENKQRVNVKHTLAGLTISALSSALVSIGLKEYDLALVLIAFSMVTGAFYFVKEFPYWLQKVMDVIVFYNSIKPIAELIQKESPKLDTSRHVINKSLKDIEIAMKQDNPELNMNPDQETS